MSRPDARIRRTTLALAAAGVLAGTDGCGRSAGVLFQPSDSDPRWPQPPDTPRIRYLGQLRTDQDLKPGRGPGKGLAEVVFGKEPAHGMLSPLAVCTDTHSRVFVADSNAQVIHVFDLASRRYSQWRPGEKQPRLSQPVALAHDPAGRLLVSDSVAGVIVVFDDSGTCTGTMAGDALNRPCGIAVDAAGGRLFVADSAAHQVVVLSREGAEVARIGRRGSGPGEFNFPTNVALDSRGNLYVSDSLNFRVQVFAPDLTPVRQIGRKGDMPGYFSQPKGLALDAEDHLYVVDANFEAVQLFDDQGRLLMSFGREGRGPGEFWLPAGIHIDGSGRVWIADSYNKRVQVFEFLPEGHSP
jgi:DNA-binding beta-propeller fold protein YncE